MKIVTQSIRSLVLMLICGSAWAADSHAPGSALAVISTVINPRSFGAICDGNSHPLSSIYDTLAAANARYPNAIALTDELDGTAINAAAAGLRRETANGGAGVLTLHGGICLANQSLNFTAFNPNQAATLDFAGSQILSTASGAVAVDFMGSQNLTVMSLNLLSPITGMAPMVGVQLGRPGPYATSNGGGMHFVGLHVDGYYTRAAVYNLNSEVTLFSKSYFSNNQSSETAYSLIQDGVNHFEAFSPFVSVTQTANVLESFNENTFLNCVFARGGNAPAPAIWMSNTTSHRYYDSYIANTTGGHAVILHSLSGSDANNDLTFDVHSETGALDDIFYVEANTLSNITMYGLKYYDHFPNASNAIFAYDRTVSGFTLQFADIAVGGTPKTTQMFSSAGITNVDGVFKIAGGNVWNLMNNGQWSGSLAIAGNGAHLNVPVLTINGPGLSAKNCGKDGFVYGNRHSGVVGIAANVKSCEIHFPVLLTGGGGCVVSIRQGAAVTYYQSVNSVGNTELILSNATISAQIADFICSEF